jgi:hypothetical protein
VFAISPVSFPEIQRNIFGPESSVAAYAMSPAPQPEYRLAPVTVGQQVHVIYLISPAK